MSKKKTGKKPTKKQIAEESRRVALHYMITLVDVAREAFLILDPKLRVISANQIFYHSFRVKPKQTIKTLLYNLGNGQWNIPELRRLLEEILPKKKVVRNFEVTHTFPKIGKKTILLNARQIDSVQMIILAMEDISERKFLEDKLVESVKDLALRVKDRTAELFDRVQELEKLNDSMVGREVKMVSLKKDILELKTMLKRSQTKRSGK